MGIQTLNNPNVYPSDEVLAIVLGENNFELFKNFREIVTEGEYALILEWRFYNDGKQWLCKMLYKKRTILWLSISSGTFSISFHFAERLREQVLELPISHTIKEEFAQTKAIGHLVSMLITIHSKEQIIDILTIIRLKKYSK